ncbi:MAG: glycosyltransferase family 4 protein [Acidobacteria bacterium]|nr:glycosyltransferase family 4 protein [Acidobacteriota bacterium]
MKTSRDTYKSIKVGIVANEFFGREVGGFGGFGWAARQVALLFNEHPELGFEAVFLNRTLPRAAGGGRVHNTPLITRGRGRLSDIPFVRAVSPDLLLMIDYRPGFRFFAGALPRTPIVVWVRDPRTPEDVRKIDTLRIPGAEGERPQGIDEIDCKSLGRIVRASRLLARRVLFAAQSTHLAGKVPGAYGVKAPEVYTLPNPLDLEPTGGSKSERPRVIFLGRHDPIKRPWLFAELAGRFPEVEFLLLGHNHFEGEGAWRPERLPPNVRLPGHLDGAEKSRLLSSAWMLVNTSIHESMGMSILEALSCETPVVSCQNPDEVVSRFGIYVGRWDGDGRASLPHFAEAVGRLLSDGEARARLGSEGRAWVNRTHNPERFLEAFRSLCVRAGVWKG